MICYMYNVEDWCEAWKMDQFTSHFSQRHQRGPRVDMGFLKWNVDMALGQNLRYFLGNDYPPKVYFTGFCDVHRDTGLLTHCHMYVLFSFSVLPKERIVHLLEHQAVKRNIVRQMYEAHPDYAGVMLGGWACGLACWQPKVHDLAVMHTLYPP